MTTALDYVDLELCIIALEHFIRDMRKRWTYLDGLIADRAYEQTRLGAAR
jgi:hypothetical protein